jgi:hypothetical protein
MKTKIHIHLGLLAVLACLSTLNPQLSAAPVGSAFTYQGRLDDGGLPAKGSYDLTFTLYDAATGGNTVAGPITNSPVSVANGLFVATLDFGAGVFTGEARWLEIGVRTNGLTDDFISIRPRQPLTPTPYAINAQNVTGTLPASYTNAVSFNNPANVLVGSHSGNGAGLSNVNAATVGGLEAEAFWQLGGNNGTAAGAQFLGTTDNQPLELKVNGRRTLRLEPNPNGGPNVIGGHWGNSVTGEGITVAGGGSVGLSNHVEANYSTVSGGRNHLIENSVGFSTIGGGDANAIRGGSFSATIAGGAGQTIGSDSMVSTIGGGQGDGIGSSAPASTIGGGYGNQVRDYASGSFLGGGWSNTIQINAAFSAVADGLHNTIAGNARSATISGGESNTVAGAYSFAAGRRAKAGQTGTFVWADSTDADFASTAANQFLIRATGGVGIDKTNPATALDVSGTVTATAFAGSGAGLTGIGTGALADNSVNAAKILDGSVAGADLADSAVTSAKIADGTIGAADVAANTFWGTAGNAGTTAGAHFLGTTDNQPLEFKVNGLRTFRLEPNTSGAPNVIGGSPRNFVGPGVVGATVGGGGATNWSGDAYTNAVLGDGGVVGGGLGNTIQPRAMWSTIGGGVLNTIQTNSIRSTISGGAHNMIQTNTDSATIGGGLNNLIQSDVAFATVSGGMQNTIHYNASWSTIGGGEANNVQPNAEYATIGGGWQNTIQTNAVCATIGGGYGNTVQTNASCAGIGGGYWNTNSGPHATIGGGIHNRASGAGAVIAGGGHDGSSTNGNTASGPGSVIGGGTQNLASGSRGTVGGGHNNSATNWYAAVPGGAWNLAGGEGSFAAGRAAKVLHDGTFVWSGNLAPDFTSTAAEQFLIRANGGVGINKNNPATALDVSGTVTATAFAGSGASLTGIGTGALADSSVNAAKIVDGSVGTADLANNAVTSAKILDGTVTSADIADGTIGAADVAANTFWGTGGNTGTTAGTHFLGTTDNQPLELKANGLRALRLEPHAISPNVIGGFSGNGVAAGNYGSTIGGGGILNYSNAIFGNFATIAGGAGNSIQGNAESATIGGGQWNTIQTNADSATIAGGAEITIQTGAGAATVGGGSANTIQANAYYAIIGGGSYNTIRTNADWATLGGGYYNTIETNADWGTIAGGWFNTIQTNTLCATIGGGLEHEQRPIRHRGGRRAQPRVRGGCRRRRRGL